MLRELRDLGFVVDCSFHASSIGGVIFMIHDSCVSLDLALDHRHEQTQTRRTINDLRSTIASITNVPGTMLKIIPIAYSRIHICKSVKIVGNIGNIDSCSPCRWSKGINPSQCISMDHSVHQKQVGQ